jgi:hypothetical protein
MYEANLSNHRGMFLDITESILDTKVKLSRPTKRHIGSKSKPKTIYGYKQYIHKQFVLQRIYGRAENIKNLAEQGPATPELEKRINNLDKQVTEIMLSAEKNYCPLQHETAWLGAIHQQALLC